MSSTVSINNTIVVRPIIGVDRLGLWACNSADVLRQSFTLTSFPPDHRPGMDSHGYGSNQDKQIRPAINHN